MPDGLQVAGDKDKSMEDAASGSVAPNELTNAPLNVKNCAKARSRWPTVNFSLTAA